MTNSYDSKKQAADYGYLLDIMPRQFVLTFWHDNEFGLLYHSNSSCKVVASMGSEDDPIVLAMSDGDLWMRIWYEQTVLHGHGSPAFHDAPGGELFKVENIFQPVSEFRICGKNATWRIRTQLTSALEVTLNFGEWIMDNSLVISGAVALVLGFFATLTKF